MKRFFAFCLFIALLTASAALADAPATVIANKMTVRAEPSADSEQIGALKKGTKVTFLSESDGIAKIEYKGNVGYALMSALKVSATATPVPTATPKPIQTASGTAGYVAVPSLRFYKSQSASGTALGTLSFGDSVDVLEWKNGWAKIDVHSAVGYAPVAALSRTAPGGGNFKTATVKSQTNAYVTDSAGSTNLGAVKKGWVVNVISQSGSFTLIEKSGMVGYVATGALEIQRDENEPESLTRVSYDAVVTAASLTVYEEANKNSKSLGSVYKNDEVRVTAEGATFAQIEKNGRTGCVLKSGLAEKDIEPEPEILIDDTPYEAVANQKIKVYKEADETSKSLGSLKQYEQVTVLATSRSWAKVQKDNRTGYCALSAISPVAEEELTAVTQYVAVLRSKQNLMKSPASSVETVSALAAGTEVIVKAEGSNWAQVTTGNASGYVQKNALTNASANFVEKSEAVYATSNQTVYRLPHTASGSLGTLKKETQVLLVATDGTWAKIEKDGVIGYVKAAALKTVPYTTLKSGDSGTTVLKLQKRLEALGYFDAIPAGNYLDSTTKAIERFQAQAGLSVTGVATPETQTALYASSAPYSPIVSASYERGDAGDDITRIQTRLTVKGYYTISIDGDYGAMTFAAVYAFQEASDLPVTGKADSKTLKLLFSSSAKSKPDDMQIVTDPDDVSKSGGILKNVNAVKAEIVIALAMEQLGKPYIYATGGPDSFDCTGLTQYCYKAVGVKLSRSAIDVGYLDGTKITYEQLQRGDIVCLNTIEDNDLSDHVGIYLGNGSFLHASSSAGKVVISSLTSGYYKKVFSWGKRVL